MSQVVADITGTTATGRPSTAGSSYCSTEAKYELKSTNRQRRVMAEPDIAPVSEYLAPESQGRAPCDSAPCGSQSMRRLAAGNALQDDRRLTADDHHVRR